ncbi:MAG: aspartate dehydrogenase [Elusimicrobia bacterium]|nr:aspartate dehydrogenase [Elusimicrobiota bacterium]
MKKISLVGCGTIGREIANAIYRKIIPAKLVAIYDINPESCRRLKKKLNDISNGVKLPAVCRTLRDAIRPSDIVVECAGQKAVREIAAVAFPMKKDLFVMSVGALIRWNDIIKRAKKNGCRVYFPSGAIAGLDAVAAASLGKVDSVRLITRKPPKSLGLDISREKTVFRGRARDAVRNFPANINVAAALSIAGIGQEKTQVEIIADPKVQTNTHRVEITGDFGRITTCTENIPSPTNPKTSYLAILSAIAELRKIVE